jgi:hypothetical protein
MDNIQMSRRKFLQAVGAIVALFTLGGITSFLSSSEAPKSGYGASGYGK